MRREGLEKGGQEIVCDSLILFGQSETGKLCAKQ